MFKFERLNKRLKFGKSLLKKMCQHEEERRLTKIENRVLPQLFDNKNKVEPMIEVNLPNYALLKRRLKKSQSITVNKNKVKYELLSKRKKKFLGPITDQARSFNTQNSKDLNLDSQEESFYLHNLNADSESFNTWRSYDTYTIGNRIDNSLLHILTKSSKTDKLKVNSNDQFIKSQILYHDVTRINESFVLKENKNKITKKREANRKRVSSMLTVFSGF